MDIALTDEQNAYRDTFRAWLDANMPADRGWPTYRGPVGEEANADFQKAWERMLYDAGYAGIAVPKLYGGQGLTAVEHWIVAEELGLRAAPEGLSIIGTEVIAPLLLAVGTEAQKTHYIPRMLRLDDLWCQGFSEPGAGSDLAALKTRAVREGDEWVINGQKIWTSHAQHATHCALLARTDPGADRHKGMTLFIVDMASVGISVRPIVQITGRAEFNEVFLENVRVPDSRRIGPENGGWALAMGVLNAERASTRMHRNGRYRHEFNHLLEIAGRRDAGGARALDESACRQRLAEIYADLEIQRYHDLKAVSAIASGGQPGAEASIAKLHWSELHQRMTEFALDLLGDAAMGYGSDGARWRDLYLESRSDTIYAGTSEIQRNIIAERLMGLPR